MYIQDPFFFYHELQHLIFKCLSSFLPLILSFVVPILLLLLLLLLLEPRLSINLMVVMSMSKALLCSPTIRKDFVVPQCRGVVCWQVGVRLEVVTSLLIHILCFFNLVGLFFLIPLRTISPSFSHFSNFMCSVNPPLSATQLVHNYIKLGFFGCSSIQSNQTISPHPVVTP